MPAWPAGLPDPQMGNAFTTAENRITTDGGHCQTRTGDRSQLPLHRAAHLDHERTAVPGVRGLAPLAPERRDQCLRGSLEPPPGQGTLHRVGGLQAERCHLVSLRRGRDRLCHFLISPFAGQVMAATSMASRGSLTLTPTNGFAGAAAAGAAPTPCAGYVPVTSAGRWSSTTGNSKPTGLS